MNTEAKEFKFDKEPRRHPQFGVTILELVRMVNKGYVSCHDAGRIARDILDDETAGLLYASYWDSQAYAWAVLNAPGVTDEYKGAFLSVRNDMLGQIEDVRVIERLTREDRIDGELASRVISRWLDRVGVKLSKLEDYRRLAQLVLDKLPGFVEHHLDLFLAANDRDLIVELMHRLNRRDLVPDERFLNRARLRCGYQINPHQFIGWFGRDIKDLTTPDGKHTYFIERDSPTFDHDDEVLDASGVLYYAAEKVLEITEAELVRTYYYLAPNTADDLRCAIVSSDGQVEAWWTRDELARDAAGVDPDEDVIEAAVTFGLIDDEDDDE